MKERSAPETSDQAPSLAGREAAIRSGRLDEKEPGAAELSLPWPPADGPSEVRAATSTLTRSATVPRELASPAARPSFEAVYERHVAFVWRSLRMLGVPGDGLDDAAQDVFGVVARQLPHFEGRSSLRTWVFGITQNVASNHRRSRARKLARLDSIDDAAGSAALDELSRRVPTPHAHAEGREAADRRAPETSDAGGQSMNDKSFHGCNTRRGVSRSAALALGAAYLGLACGSERLSLGEGEAPLEPGDPVCNGGVVQGSVEVRNQLELDALAGCEEIVGNLWVHAFAGVDLRPLASLRIVRGDMAVGPNDSGFDLVASLEGLEALEQVSRLSIHYLGAADLAPLANLKRVELDRQSPWNEGGSIDISGCPNLSDLRGLGGLEQWDELHLDGNESLASLDGISLPADGEPIIRIDHAPALQDVSALDGLERVGTLQLSNTGLEHIEPLRMTIIRTLALMNNDALVDIDGLAALQVVGLSISENDALDHLPEWPELLRMNDVQITNNASLRTIPEYAVDYAPLQVSLGSLMRPSNNPDVVQLDQFLLFEVSGNPRLDSLTLPTGLERGQYIGIYDNASLTALNLNSMSQLEQLSIRNNAVLSSVALGELNAVDTLAVENNPLLPSQTFADVASFTRLITGNAGDTP